MSGDSRTMRLPAHRRFRTRAAAACRRWPAAAALALAVGALPALAVPLAQCTPAAGPDAAAAPGLPEACALPVSTVGAEGARGSFAAAVRSPLPAAAPSELGPAPAEDEPVGGLVAVAAVAAVLSLSLRHGLRGHGR